MPFFLAVGVDYLMLAPRLRIHAIAGHRRTRQALDRAAPPARFIIHTSLPQSSRCGSYMIRERQSERKTWRGTGCSKGGAYRIVGQDFAVVPEIVGRPVDRHVSADRPLVGESL